MAICPFVAGVAAAYLGLVPFLLDLVATNAIEAGFAPTYSIATWTSFVLVYSTWIGLGALLPLVMGITTAVGVVSNGAFRRRWPVAGIVCLSSVLNWSIDPFTVFFAAVPVVLCYGVGVGAATVSSTWRGRRRPDADRTIARRDADPGTTAVDRVTVTAERDVARGDRDTGARLVALDIGVVAGYRVGPLFVRGSVVGPVFGHGGRSISGRVDGPVAVSMSESSVYVPSSSIIVHESMVVVVLADPLASPAPVNAERAAAATTSAMVTVSTSMVCRDIAFACTGRLLVTFSVFLQR